MNIGGGWTVGEEECWEKFHSRIRVRLWFVIAIETAHAPGFSAGGGAGLMPALSRRTHIGRPFTSS